MMRRRCREQIESIPDIPRAIRCELPRYHLGPHRSSQLRSPWRHCYMADMESDALRGPEMKGER